MFHVSMIHLYCNDTFSLTLLACPVIYKPTENLIDLTMINHEDVQ